MAPRDGCETIAQWGRKGCAAPSRRRPGSPAFLHLQLCAAQSASTSWARRTKRASEEWRKRRQTQLPASASIQSKPRSAARRDQVSCGACRWAAGQNSTWDCGATAGGAKDPNLGRTVAHRMLQEPVDGAPSCGDPERGGGSCEQAWKCRERGKLKCDREDITRRL